MGTRRIWLACAAALAACSSSDLAAPPPAPAPQPPAVDAPSPRAPAQPAPPAPGTRLPDDAAPISYDLRLELDPDREAFEGNVTIRVELARPTDRVWLHLDELDLHQATFAAGGGPPAPLTELARGDQMRAFGFGRVLPAGEVELALSYTGHTRHDEQGLFRQRAGGRWYLVSQAESVFARRFVPCFDEPRFKAPWRVTLVVPASDVALANTPEASARVLAAGRREVTFAESPPMPAYLLGLAVGPFELVDVGPVGRAHVPARVAALAGQRGQVGVAAAKLPAIIDAAEALLGDALPLAKLDLVAVPHLFGAMENPGLITFDDHILAGDPARPGFTGRFVEVAAHEVVHQWFGDLVTPAWWDDLWLAEAFASYLGGRIAERVGGITDVPLWRALEREHALDADGPHARPLHAAVARGEDAENDFDEISYDKGDAVLETIAAWQGDDAFLGGLRAFLHAHRGGTATADDLFATERPPAARALASYVDRAGAPVVELALRCTGTPELDARVRGDAAVPVCVRYGDDRGDHEACVLAQGRAALTLEGGCPAWVAGHARDGYYDVAWQTGGPLGPLPPGPQLRPEDAIAAGDDVAAALERREVTAAAALAALDRLAAGDAYAQLGAAAIARALERQVPDAVRPLWAAYLARRLGSRLGHGAPSSPAGRVLHDEIAALAAP